MITAVKKRISKVTSIIRSKSGEFYIDKVIGMIIAVVIGGLLLAGLYSLFNDTVLPGLADKIQSIFS